MISVPYVTLSKTCNSLWESEVIVDHVLTSKSWMHSFDPELKWHYAEWCFFITPWRKIAGYSWSALIK